MTTVADVKSLLMVAVDAATAILNEPAPPPAPTYPAWRQGKAVGSLITLTGTKNMSGIAELQGGGALGGFGTIDAWNGLANDDTTLYSVCNGGHGFPWNGDYRLDLSVDNPAWKTYRPSSTQIGTAEYYPDGTLCSRHTYYMIAKTGRKIVFPGCYAAYGIGMAAPAYQGGPQTNVYDLDTKTFVAAPNNPSYNSVTSVCVHPTTGEVYSTSNQVFAKFDPTANTWTKLPTPAFAGDANWMDQCWQFKPTLIDLKRSRWACFHSRPKYNAPPGPPDMAYCGLDMKTMARQQITGDLPSVSDYAAATHDLDNDKYIIGEGTGIYSVDPDTLVSVKLATVPAPANGWNGRVKYIAKLGGIVIVPSFNTDALFIPTR